MGEGEETMRELAAALESGSSVKDIKGIAYRNDENKIVINPRRERIKDLDILPFPAYHKIPIENYISSRQPHGAGRGRSMPIIGTRGCPFSCTFCTAANMWETKWITRNPSKVVDEIEYHIKKYNVNDFHFEDLSSIIKKDWIMQFSEEIMKRNIKISWQLPVGIRSEKFDKEVAQTISKAGCTNITFAPESGSLEILQWADKRVDLNNMYEAAGYSVKAGIKVCGFIIIGFPNETTKDVKATFQVLRKLARVGFHEVSITTFCPLPGSEVFCKLLNDKEIELTDEFYENLIYMSDLIKVKSWNVNFTDEQLARLRIKGYANFFLTAYLFRPWRFVKSLINIILNKQDNKLEKVVYDIICRKKIQFKNMLGINKKEKVGVGI